MSIRKDFANAIRKPIGACLLAVTIGGTAAGTTHALHDWVSPDYQDQTTEQSESLRQGFLTAQQKIKSQNARLNTIRDLKEAAVEKLNRGLALELSDEILQGNQAVIKAEQQLEAGILLNENLTEQDFIKLNDAGAVTIPLAQNTYRFSSDQRHFFKEAQTEVFLKSGNETAETKALMVETEMKEMAHSANKSGRLITSMGLLITLFGAGGFAFGGGAGGLANRIENTVKKPHRKRDGLKRN